MELIEFKTIQGWRYFKYLEIFLIISRRVIPYTWIVWAGDPYHDQPQVQAEATPAVHFMQEKISQLPEKNLKALLWQPILLDPDPYQISVLNPDPLLQKIIRIRIQFKNCPEIRNF